MCDYLIISLITRIYICGQLSRPSWILLAFSTAVIHQIQISASRTSIHNDCTRTHSDILLWIVFFRYTSFPSSQSVVFPSHLSGTHDTFAAMVLHYNTVLISYKLRYLTIFSLLQTLQGVILISGRLDYVFLCGKVIWKYKIY